SVVCRIKGEKIFLAFFPRKERPTEIITEKIKLLIFFHKMIETKGRLKKMAISSKNQHFLLVSRGAGLILLETKGAPSQELEDLFNVAS
ncbi:MAG: hypothetical protein GWO20_13290, partial [Candidatus Korarchaeota archaeon]|nr:hypothetical protein [Candidatus Korarchaeota archaeon]NIU84369.1 hypothetical protein [Candidatus Thorarchaeota archaeon]NIW14485.1 hypothetical protein [Candidatus Thorarchaeota archaeon]NIW52562.1 hypothetical protein [Candidatus Korarchaeota archaeon]